VSAVKRAQEKQKEAAKGKKRRLGLSNDRGSEAWTLNQDAALAIMVIAMDWVRSGGYMALYGTSDGGALCVSLKHDSYEDEKIYIHDSDDAFALADRYGAIE
jgi:hypothetical protein